MEYLKKRKQGKNLLECCRSQFKIASLGVPGGLSTSPYLSRFVWAIIWIHEKRERRTYVKQKSIDLISTEAHEQFIWERHFKVKTILDVHFIEQNANCSGNYWYPVKCSSLQYLRDELSDHWCELEVE